MTGIILGARGHFMSPKYLIRLEGPVNEQLHSDNDGMTLHFSRHSPTADTTIHHVKRSKIPWLHWKRPSTRWPFPQEWEPFQPSHNCSMPEIISSAAIMCTAERHCIFQRLRRASASNSAWWISWIWTTWRRPWRKTPKWVLIVFRMSHHNQHLFPASVYRDTHKSIVPRPGYSQDRRNRSL